jgi:hypothetical protein
MDNMQIARRASTVLYDFLKRDVSNGDKYLLPANICPIVPAVFYKAGVQFKLVDISAKTNCIDWNACLNLAKSDLSNKWNLLYVHSYGYEDFAFATKLKTWKEEFPESKVIDDRCLAKPSLIKQNHMSDIELYSTGYSKLLEIGHTGWGIYNKEPSELDVNSDYDELLHNALVLTFSECIREEKAVKFNFSSNWLDQQAPILSIKELSKEIQNRLNNSLNRRLKLNAIYLEYLNEWAMPSDFNIWRFNILVPKPAELLNSIGAMGHFASSHYQSLTTIFDQKEAPVASSIGCHIVNLFNDHRYDESRVEDLAKKLRKLLNKKNEN